MARQPVRRNERRDFELFAPVEQRELSYEGSVIRIYNEELDRFGPNFGFTLDDDVLRELDYIYRNADARKREEIARDIRNMCKKHSMVVKNDRVVSSVKLEEAYDKAVQQYSAVDSLLPLPERAPKLWKDREPGRGTNPAKFIQETYGPWIGSGLTKAQLLKLDAGLYSAYAQWIRPSRHPADRIEALEGAGPHNRINDAELAIQRRREREREAAVRKRLKKRLGAN